MDSHALYIHIPFCRHRCTYCDFNTYTTVRELQVPYVTALIREIRQVGVSAQQSGEQLSVHSVFFGGGTPSLLTAAEVGDILSAVHESVALAPNAEITLEANPTTVDKSYLVALREAGVNRLSYGVQSALAGELELLGRDHDFETAVRALQTARAAGFDNVNLDLIYGLPGQTVSDWEKSVTAALAIRPEHLSFYCLTIEPGTPMQRWLQNGTIAPPDGDVAADQYQLAGDLLAAEGYEHYEISNWALPDHECRHNLTYWRDEPYLGLGAGAHGYAGGYRYQIVRQPRVYIRRMENEPPGVFPLSAAVAESHVVDRPEAMSDMVITQLRLLREGWTWSSLPAASVHRLMRPTMGPCRNWRSGDCCANRTIAFC
ncbi:MAG: radical SAM family heme chaperone HemW [Chloroflexota bacterium]